MTVSTTARSISYTANGGTTVFAYNFKIDAAADLKVYLDGVLQVSGYSVSGVRSASGGNVTFTSAPANLVTVEFVRETSLTQLVDIANNETVYEDAFEVPLDKLTMIAQEHAARLDDHETRLEDVEDGLAATGTLSSSALVLPAGATTARTLAAHLATVVNILDFGATTASADCTANIQAAIDSLGANGGTVFVPPVGTFRAAGIKLNGTSGTQSYVLLLGDGIASHIAAPTNSNLNVIEATAGQFCGVENLRITGSKLVGGTPVRAPTKGFWTTGTSYVVGDTVEVSSTDVATTTVAASNLVYTCTTNHVAGATFLADKATKWAAAPSAANYNTADLSYRYRNGVYLDNCVGGFVRGCYILSCVYAGVNLGTGPVQAANQGPGIINGMLIGNRVAACENGIAGGKWFRCTIQGNTVYEPTVYGIVSDIGSSGVTITGNAIVGPSTRATTAIFMYASVRFTISGNSIDGGFLRGIIADSNSYSGTISANQIADCSEVGIYVRSSNFSSVTANALFACGYGIQSVTAFNCSFIGNVVRSCTLTGIFLSTATWSTVTGNVCTSNAGGGISLASSSDNSSIAGNVCMDNTGPGIQIANSICGTVSGNTAGDTRGGGSRTQTHGLQTTGTSDYWAVSGNLWRNNSTANTALVGANNVSTGASVSL